MTTTLCILRHGRASGQGPTAALLPEGEAYVLRLGRLLARGGLRPAAAYTSPYRRASDTASLLLAELASDTPLVRVDELAPETDPARALAALRALGTPRGHVLVVSHLPLVARLADRLLGNELGFQPGSYAEIELSARGAGGALRRFVGPDELDAS